MKAFLELDEHITPLPSETSRSSPSDKIPAADIFVGIPHLYTLQDLLELLPSRVEIDRYIASWFNLRDPCRVILHAPTVQHQCKAFWSEPNAVQPAWFALLLAISSLGAETSGQTLNDSNVQSQAHLLRRLTEHALLLAEVTKPQPFLIEALFLHVVSLLYHHHDVSSLTWQLIGLTLRLCHQAGYHRDPSHNAKISRFDCEMRRRVWMVVCELEIVRTV